MDEIQKKIYFITEILNSCLSDRQILSSGLSDILMGVFLHINLLMIAYDENVVERLNNSDNTTTAATKLIKRLHNNYGISYNYCFWSVITWLYILKHDDDAIALSNMHQSNSDVNNIQINVLKETRNSGIQRMNLQRATEIIKNQNIYQAMPCEFHSFGIVIKTYFLGKVFIPRSQLCLEDDETDLRLFSGRKVLFSLLSYDDSKRIFVGSCRDVVKKRTAELQKISIHEITIDDNVCGVIETIYEEGAFINLGGIFGLVHKDHLVDWNSIAVGDYINLFVDKIDVSRQWITLKEW